MKYIVIFLSICLVLSIGLAACNKFKRNLATHPHAHLKAVALKHMPHKAAPFLNK